MEIEGTRLARDKSEEGSPRTLRSRLRRVLEAARAVPWEAEARTRRFTHVGPQAVEIFGYPLRQWYERGFWEEHIHVEDRPEVLCVCREASHLGRPYELDYRMIGADRREVWVRDIVTVECVSGQPATLSGFMVDIGARKQGERALRMYRDLYDNAPDMFCSVDTASGRILQCNRALTEKTGFSKEEILGRHIFDLYHPDCLDDVKKARESFKRTGDERDLEFQLRRKDGGRIDVSLNVSAVRDETGQIRHSRSVWRDITRRKRAEAELRTSGAALRESEQKLQRLAGELLSSQEDERRRLARELHDDLTQQLASLALEAGRVARQLAPVSGPALEALHLMRDRLSKLSTDVHDISRQLHPAILDDLGLATAIESECASWQRRTGLTVHFAERNVPPDLPGRVGLCIYRIAQEGLRNVEKHARTGRACMLLEGVGDEVVLVVEDAGVGFDPDRLRKKAGLGLASMRERARLIGGSLSVRSRPGQGTRIEVRAPARS